MANLSLRHVYKIYDNGTKAVNDFNLEVGNDEFVVFVGPSGCGKSTTLRMIAGLEDITAGDFYIDGKLANQLEPKDRDMAMVFQNYALYPHMTVYENMAFGLKIRHIPKTEIEQRVHEAAKILDIEDQLKKKPKAMSGGQRQRVALGRAIVRKPKVFLLDEPLSNLDAKLRSSMRSEITRLHNVLKTTFIYVTHDQVEAMTMGTRIVVMRDGLIQQVDTPMNLYDYPENIFVAGFIGTPQMNFLDATLSLKDKVVSIAIGEKVLLCPLESLSRLDYIHLYRGEDVKIGIRPEHLKITNKDDNNSLPARVVIVEALGNESNLILETLDGNVRFTARVLRNDSISVGDEVNVALDFDKMHIFDKESERTLVPCLPKSTTVKASFDGKKLKLLGHSLNITEMMKEKLKGNKELYITIPRSALIEGKDVSLDVESKVKIGDYWLSKAKYENEYVYFDSKDYLYGDKLEFSLNYAELTIYNSSLDVLLEPIEEENSIRGSYFAVKREMFFDKNTMISKEDMENRKAEAIEKGLKAPRFRKKNMRLFEYQLLGANISPSDTQIIKVYSLLGKKFHLHNVDFIIPADAMTFDENGIVKGKVVEVMDYGNALYYKVLTDNDITLVVKGDDNSIELDKEVTLNIDKERIGVYDVNFGVRLI